MPELPAFAPGFTRVPMPSRYAGGEGKEAATRSLAEAEAALNRRIASGPAAAYVERTTPASRLHRPGSLPVVGAEAIAKWLVANAPSMSASSTAAEAAKSGEIGYSYGTYEAASAEKGAYVRIWTRDATGRWFVMADVTQPAR